LIKKLSISEAVGKALAHDITEIRPGEFKGVAFRRGTEICDGDLCHLQRLGKNHLYVIDLEEDEVHEDEAALKLAHSLAGKGVRCETEPREGKIRLFADQNGLLIVDTELLLEFNMVDEVMCATLHQYSVVEKGELVGATRAIPLVMKRSVIESAAALARSRGGVLSVVPLNPATAGVVITGNEIHSGLIEDRFEPVIRQKLESFSSVIKAIDVVPDDAHRIGGAIRSQINRGCDLVLLSGGMSVDPDDVTRQGVLLAGATEINYGASVLPGAMFMVAYVGGIPILGVPACGIYHKITALDLVLPRILAGQHVTKNDLAALGHGGLCRNCPECIFPRCAFGKNT